jgi:hypothetical protein
MTHSIFFFGTRKENIDKEKKEPRPTSIYYSREIRFKPVGRLAMEE